MSVAGVVAIIGAALAVLTHTAVLFRWGGRVTTLLEAHEKSIEHLEARDRLVERLTVTVETLERRMRTRAGEPHGEGA